MLIIAYINDSMNTMQAVVHKTSLVSISAGFGNQKNVILINSYSL